MPFVENETRYGVVCAPMQVIIVLLAKYTY
jgi:hypothetical protein